MPKHPRRPSESRAYPGSHSGTDPDYSNSLRRLASTYRAAAVEEFGRLAREVEGHPSLLHVEKVATVLEALSAISEVLGRLSRTAPEIAPELWENRTDKNENAFEFTRRVYKDYLLRGLSKQNILSLDRKLYQAIADRERRYSDDSLSLPNQRAVTDSLLSKSGGEASFSKIVNSLPELFGQRIRLYYAIASRRRRASKPKAK